MLFQYVFNLEGEVASRERTIQVGVDYSVGKILYLECQSPSVVVEAVLYSCIEGY